MGQAAQLRGERHKYARQGEREESGEEKSGHLVIRPRELQGKLMVWQIVSGVLTKSGEQRNRRTVAGETAGHKGDKESFRSLLLTAE